MISTATVLLGFLVVDGGVMSHIYTEGDRGAEIFLPTTHLEPHNKITRQGKSMRKRPDSTELRGGAHPLSTKAA